MKKVVLLFSPGLDSYLSNSILSKRNDIELYRIYFDCCRYSSNEIDFMKYRYDLITSLYEWTENKPYVNISKDLNFRDIEQENAHIPNRNLMFVTAASAMYPDADEIYINSMKDDRAPDSERFLFEDYAPILSDSVEKKVEIKSLFWEKEKAQVVLEFICEGGSGIDLLLHTYSCFDEKMYNEKFPVYNCLETVSGNMYKYFGEFFISGCRKCSACFRRACALTAANIYIPFDNKELIEKYRPNVDAKLYPERHQTIKKYLEFLDNGKKSISV